MHMLPGEFEKKAAKKGLKGRGAGRKEKYLHLAVFRQKEGYFTGKKENNGWKNLLKFHHLIWKEKVAEACFLPESLKRKSLLNPH